MHTEHPRVDDVDTMLSSLFILLGNEPDIPSVTFLLKNLLPLIALKKLNGSENGIYVVITNKIDPLWRKVTFRIFCGICSTNLFSYFLLTNAIFAHHRWNYFLSILFSPHTLSEICTMHIKRERWKNIAFAPQLWKLVYRYPCSMRLSVNRFNNTAYQ